MSGEKILNTILGVYGAGGHGKETLAIIRESNWRTDNSSLNFDKIVFVESNPSNTNLQNIPILSETEFLEIDYENKFMTVAIGDSLDRGRIVERFRSMDVEFLSVISGKAMIHPNAIIGMGAIVSPFAFISTDVKIGSFFQANVRASVSHDCTLGDFVTLSPGVVCNGNVEIGDNVFIGSGAIIRNGSKSKKIIIGDNAVIGMGAIVTKSVASHAKVIGNPARPMNSR
jgi:sugar O-acyltransferase (sialic acid O-acetyltransferase NeuD family)